MKSFISGLTAEQQRAVISYCGPENFGEDKFKLDSLYDMMYHNRLMERENSMNSPTAHMLVGVPGSGKSTWVSNVIHNEPDMKIVSTDYHIERMAYDLGINYDEAFHSCIKLAEEMMYDDLSEITKKGQSFIWDQTNLSKKSRARKLSMIPKNYSKVAVVFPTPIQEELDRRLASRPGKTISPTIIKSMCESLQIPTVDEGFNRVVVMNDEELSYFQ